MIELSALSREFTIRRLDEADAERILAILDGDAFPITKRIPETVSGIVNEEISGFLAGRGSASECAGKIQSRASLWLAEHR